MRASGILLPVTSLPSPYGIGCFSKEAYEFVDQLEKGGEKYWQILPLGPTGYGDSPYQSFSTYAGNPYFIDLETLIEEGLLTKEECDSVDFGSNPAYVDYEKIYMGRFELLEKAFHRFVPDQAYETFVEKMAGRLQSVYGDQKQPGRNCLERVGGTTEDKTGSCPGRKTSGIKRTDGFYLFSTV